MQPTVAVFPGEEGGRREKRFNVTRRSLEYTFPRQRPIHPHAHERIVSDKKKEEAIPWARGVRGSIHIDIYTERAQGRVIENTDTLHTRTHARNISNDNPTNK